MDLRKRWQQLFPVSNESEVIESFHDLEVQYAQSGRHYHTFKHIEQLLSLSDRFGSLVQDKKIVDLAIFFHDAVYIPGSSHNEIESAEMASITLIKLGSEKEIRDKIIEYILATKDHFSVETGDQDLKFFLDFDLDILSSESDVYQQYAVDIRKEYAAIPDVMYKQGRLLFLTKALQLPHLFFTEEFRQKESKAKENLQWEAEQLKRDD